MKKIVVADDDADVLDYMNETLTQNGYRVLPAATAPQALDLLVNESPRPDLLITDIRMPGASGLDLIQELERRNIFVPVLVVTGYGDKDLLIELMRKGCKDYLDKPFVQEELLSRVYLLFEREERVNNEIRECLAQAERKSLLDTRIMGREGSHRISGAAQGPRFVHFKGDIREDSASRLRQACEQLIETGAKELVLDLTEVGYVNSFGIGVIIYIWKMLKEREGGLSIIAGPEHLTAKLEDLNLSRIIQVYQTEQAYREHKEVVVR